MATRLITGLAIGSTKLCATVAKVLRDGQVLLLGSAAIPCNALKRGALSEMEVLVNGIRKLLLQLEQKTGVRITNCLFNISGDHLKLQTNQSAIFLSERGVEISQKDIERVTDSAQQIALGLDRQILHLTAVNFIVDGQEGVKNAKGIFGSQLGAQLLLLTAARNRIESLAKAVHQAGLAVEDVVYTGLAEGCSLLSEQERELGIALVNIGGDVTDITLFFEGRWVDAQTIPFGGADLTSSLVSSLAIPWHRAEELRKVYGGIPDGINHPEERIRISLKGSSQEISRRELCALLMPKLEDLLAQIQQVLNRSGHFPKLVCGIKLTGGVALTEGLIEHAERFFGTTVKLGLVHGEMGEESLPGGLFWAGSIGLVRYWVRGYTSRRDLAKEQYSLIARATSWARTIYQDYF